MTVKEILKECAVPYAAIKVKKLINMLETEKDLKFDLRYYTNDGLWYESYGEIAWENPDDSEKPYYFGVKVEGNETKGIFSFENSELDVNDVIEFLKLKTHEDRLKRLKDNEWDCYNPKKVVVTSFSHDYSKYFNKFKLKKRFIISPYLNENSVKHFYSHYECFLSKI